MGDEANVSCACSKINKILDRYILQNITLASSIISATKYFS
jgi:hypothetical protein